MPDRRKGPREGGAPRNRTAPSARRPDGAAERQAAAAAADVARYVADLTAQLETMAQAARLDLLAYFLGMARSEGEALARAADKLGAEGAAVAGDDPSADAPEEPGASDSDGAAPYDPGPPRG